MCVFIGDVYKKNEKEFCYHRLMNREIVFNRWSYENDGCVFTLSCLFFYEFWLGGPNLDKQAEH